MFAASTSGVLKVMLLIPETIEVVVEDGVLSATVEAASLYTRQLSRVEASAPLPSTRLNGRLAIRTGSVEPVVSISRRAMVASVVLATSGLVSPLVPN